MSRPSARASAGARCWPAEARPRSRRPSPARPSAKRRRRRGHGRHGGKGFGKVTDLTHTFRAGFPVYTGDEPTRRTLKNYVPDGFYSQEWTFGEHSGTHMDAPGHFVEGGRRVPQLRPEELLAPGGRDRHLPRAASDPDAEVTPDDLRRYERRHGRIPRGAHRLHELGLGRQGQRQRGVQERRRERRPTTSPASGSTRSSSSSPARHPGDRRRHAQPRPGQLDHVRRPQPAARRRPLRASRTSPTCRRCAPGRLVSVGVVPWEEGSGGPCRLLAYG